MTFAANNTNTGTTYSTIYYTHYLQYNTKQFTVNPQNVNLNFSFRDEVEGNIKVLGKQNSLFPSGPVIKCQLLYS